APRAGTTALGRRIQFARQQPECFRPPVATVEAGASNARTPRTSPTRPASRLIEPLHRALALPAPVMPPPTLIRSSFGCRPGYGVAGAMGTRRLGEAGREERRDGCTGGSVARQPQRTLCVAPCLAQLVGEIEHGARRQGHGYRSRASQ